ncbi:MAG TPA: mechanosensitive ion channel domain-containing protein [Candidatus Angelobacter sp.]|jgi:small-conductance mechanosensitive channel|nr:mechanosensitive ion channel domain-containing protein [Candidatus Angelobacter sp.]
MANHPITRPHNRLVNRLFFFAILILALGLSVFSQSSQDIISFLNQTIVWYQQLTDQPQLVKEPSDLLFLNDNRQIADQVSRLAFDFARARAPMLGPDSGTEAQPDESGSNLNQYKALAELARKSDQQIKETQQELETMRQKLPATSGQKRTLLEATIAETESELGLLQARRSSVQNMMEFVSGTASGSRQAGLQAKIEELARTLPPSVTQSGKQSPADLATLTNNNSAPVTISGAQKEPPSGIFALIDELVTLKRKLNLLDKAIDLTDSLMASSKALRDPVLAKARELVRRGDELMSEPDSQDMTVLAQQKKELDGATAGFKQLSSAMLPLGKQMILLDLYKRNSSKWRNVVSTQYTGTWKSLLVRLAILAIAVGLVLGISHLWRRVTFRYIRDIRRRHQFLLLRRIIVAVVIAIIVVVASVSGLGGIGTFAGLLSAGVAVAMQNVILAIVGYFFLVGKHGVRVGDRVQVSGIVGNVVDIGLIRMHLMELGRGPNAQPTGRIVAFSNAVVFRTHAGLYKQVPGTHFLWHEVTRNLPPGSDYRPVEEKMLEAVNKVFADYQEELEGQLRRMEHMLKTTPVESLHPESRVRLTKRGVSITIRYPVDMHHAREMDDRINREVLAEIEKNWVNG